MTTISGNSVDTISSKWIQPPNSKAEFKFRVELSDINMKIQIFARPLLSDSEDLLGEMNTMGSNPEKSEIELFKYFEKLDVTEKANLLKTNSEKPTPLNVISWQEEKLEDVYKQALSAIEDAFKNKRPEETEEEVGYYASTRACVQIENAIHSNFKDAAKKINEFIVKQIETDEARLAANKNFLKKLAEIQNPSMYEQAIMMKNAMDEEMKKNDALKNSQNQ